MITPKDAVTLGKAIILGMNTEIDNQFNAAPQRDALRGAALRILDNLWYDCCPSRTREQFGYQREAFMTAIDWK